MRYFRNETILMTFVAATISWRAVMCNKLPRTREVETAIFFVRIYLTSHAVNYDRSALNQ